MEASHNVCMKGQFELSYKPYDEKTALLLTLSLDRCYLPVYDAVWCNKCFILNNEPLKNHIRGNFPPDEIQTVKLLHMEFIKHQSE